MSTSSTGILYEKQQQILLGGGESSIERQHSKGKMTARERIEFLFDEGSFCETDMMVEHRCTDFGLDQKKLPCDGVVTGYGTIDGRLVFVYSQDFTVMGGSLGEMHAKKIANIMDQAIKVGAPCLGINDSGGARIQEGVASLSGFGDIFYRNVQASGVIPQITAIMGPCAGGAVYSPALTDFIFMTEDTSNMFITGPQVIKAVTGEDVSTQNLGGANVHMSKSGVCHFSYKTEKETLIGIKRLLSFLPSNNVIKASLLCSKNNNTQNTSLESIVPTDSKHSYDIRDVITQIVDDSDFMEVQPNYAKNIVIGFARINGRSSGIIANQPKVMAGCLEINASDKAARFIRFCDSFNIQILTLVDVPGFLPGVAQETNGIIRHGAKMLYAYSEATVPLVTVILRKAYGGAYIGMASKHLGADVVFAWPNAEIAVMGPDSAANIIFAKSENKEQKIKEYVEKFSNPYQAARLGYIDEVIDPACTRLKIVNAFNMLKNKSKAVPKRKHGNIPL